MRKVRSTAGLGVRWMTSTHISLGLLLVAACIAAKLLLSWKRRGDAKYRSQLRQIVLLRKAQDKARNEAIEEDIRRFLLTLGLPTLEEKTRLQEAARLLRIVLVERIARGR